MKTVAIICEYNPFHNGHKHQIDEIRREFGEDTRIIAIMSGSFTQRGESAIMDKGDRAKCAVLAGVNLVLELPFPFSMSSAEFFASAGVAIADGLGIVDYLSFGSECGDIERLVSHSELASNNEYTALVDEMSASDECASIGYPKICEMAFERLYSRAAAVSLTPNNILAIEYIKAIKRINSSIKPHTVTRKGAAFDEANITDGKIQSATAIRYKVSCGNFSALEFLPDVTKPVILEAIKCGAFPCDMERLAPAVISFFRLNPTDVSDAYHDAKGGLYNRIGAASFDANNISTLVSLSETKKYTNARIMRAIWYSFFGVTSSDVRVPPEYTQVLAFDGIGRACLKEIRGHGRISVLTKPSNTDGLSETAKRQKILSDRADSIFHLTRKDAISGTYSLKYTPFVKEG